jgi:hypothetical protein
MNGYDALTTYFERLPADTDEVTLTFAQVEAILKRPLPPGAWHYRTWWQPPGMVRTPPQVRAWRTAGWDVYLVDQHAGWAWFKRIAGLHDDPGV